MSVEQHFKRAEYALDELARSASPDWTCCFCGALKNERHADTCDARNVEAALFAISLRVEELQEALQWIVDLGSSPGPIDRGRDYFAEVVGRAEAALGTPGDEL